MEERHREEKSRKESNPRSLRKRLLLFIVLCWIIPILCLCIFVTISYRNTILETTNAVLEAQLTHMQEYTALRINEGITISQKISYERICEKAWQQYKKSKNKQQYFDIVSGELMSKFYLDKRFPLFAYYRVGDKKPFCYSNKSGENYEIYQAAIGDKIQSNMESISSSPQVMIIKGRVFLVRNLYTTTNYEHFGMLVVEMDTKRMFQELNASYVQDIMVCLNEPNSYVAVTNPIADDKKMHLVEQLTEKYKAHEHEKVISRVEDRNYTGYLLQTRQENYQIGTIFLVNKRELYASLYHLYGIILLITLIFVGVLFYVYFFLKNQIRIPVTRLLDVTQAIESGKIGTVVEGEDMPNAEFQELMNSFNKMSKEVSYLFNYAYNEKLAKKDAKIMALQSQINPHFLNNTLEMMNWQARMSGDLTVSKMIEALGTVLDYRMDRSNRQIIHLAEELRCADAYYYIISMRFGNRLRIEKEIDETLLEVNVPMLILQPIIENAVVHGIEQVKNGIIKIKIYREENRIYIKVLNTGKPMSEENLARIHSILSGEKDSIAQGKGRHTSLGIRNVNERIHLIYGEDYGLTIEPAEGDITESTITLPYDEIRTVSENSAREKAKNQLKRMGKIVD